LTLHRHTLALIGVLATIALAATPALAGPGLPRTYDVQQIDSPAPRSGGAFGWGVAAGDYTGDGKADLLVAQAQTGPGQIFMFDGATGQHFDTIDPPEQNPDNAAQPPVLAFVYVEHFPDIGSCPGGDGADADKICDAALIGPNDGVPEIVSGSRNLRVNKDDGSTLPVGGTTGDPRIGRGYIFDGATRAVLKRIDMPVADRQLQATLAGASPGNASPQFGRVMMAPQGLPPCSGSAAEANNLGVGDCPGPIPPMADNFSERIGDAVGDGQKPDIVITARNFNERTGPAPSPDPTPSVAHEFSAAGSHCSTGAPGGTCQGGRAWVYAGEDIVGTSPQAILDTPSYTIKDPEAQRAPSGSPEFGGNMFRLGDVGSNLPANPAPPAGDGAPARRPDGRPDFVITARNLDYPMKNPETPTYEDVGAAFLFDGVTGTRLNTYPSPEPQARSQFSGSFNSGLPLGDVGVTNYPDVVLPAPLQNAAFTDSGKTWAFRGDVLGPGGGGEQSWQFSDMTDPTPQLGEGFGASSSGVGDLVDSEPGNEMLIGAWAPFDPNTIETENIVNDLHFFNVITHKSLQTIPDPTQEGGSGFGVGITPMGDLNGDGFLDFAVSSYTSNAPPDGQGGQGRAFIFRSNNSPLPAPPTAPAPTVTAPRVLRPGSCTNDTIGTDRSERIRGTAAGDRIFGFGGRDVIAGLQSDDCIDGGRGGDRLNGGADEDRVIGRGGNDRLRGRRDDDRLFGGAGRDRLWGGFGDDLLAGGPRNDILEGDFGDDRLFGEGGNDLLRGGAGTNGLDGGRGNDRINAVNHRGDNISCGRGRRDRVLADPIDVVRVDCEIVRRKR
jgi:hypothetical protein